MVVHANELNTLEVALAYKRAERARGVKVIYDSHELETGRDWVQSRASRAIIRRYEGRLIRQADAFITVSDGLATELQRLYGVSRPAVIHNAPEAIAVGAGPCHESSVRSVVKLPPDTPLGVFVGRLKLQRGQELLLEAMSYLPDVHLAMIGPQPPRVLACHRDLAEKLGISSRVHFVAPVPPGKVVTFLRDADFGVVPTQNIGRSYEFAMPNKLFEMTLAGIPALAGDLPDIRSYLESTGAGSLMNERDPHDIARAIRETLRKGESARLAEPDLCELRKTYSWSAQARKLRALYADLAVARPACG